MKREIKYKVDRWDEDAYSSQILQAVDHRINIDTDHHNTGNLEMMQYEHESLKEIVSRMLEMYSDDQIIQILQFEKPE